jgi:hypothetical protein
MALLKLSSPWVILYKEIQAFFARDPEVKIVYDEDENVIRLYVDNDNKAYALSVLIPAEYDFGNVTLKIKVIPANNFGHCSDEMLWDNVLLCNGAVDNIKTVTAIGGQDLRYVLFEKTVVQFYTDNLGDYYGVASTLYQDIAEDIFPNHEGVYFCTNIYSPADGSEHILDPESNGWL